METTEKIQQILLGMTQGELAAKLGMERSSVSLLASGKKHPGPATCLALAGVFPEEADYWLNLSGLSHEVIATISKGLGVPTQTKRLSKQETELLDWFRNPKNKMEESFRETITHLLEVRHSVKS